LITFSGACCTSAASRTSRSPPKCKPRRPKRSADRLAVGVGEPATIGPVGLGLAARRPPGRSRLLPAISLAGRRLASRRPRAQKGGADQGPPHGDRRGAAFPLNLSGYSSKPKTASNDANTSNAKASWRLKSGGQKWPSPLASIPASTCPDNLRNMRTRRANGRLCSGSCTLQLFDRSIRFLNWRTCAN
jgi:hypothetical protein